MSKSKAADGQNANVRRKDTSRQVKITKIGSSGLHHNNRHKGRYDLQALIRAVPELEKHLVITPRGEQSINFSDPVAVKLLNKALLAEEYKVSNWDIPEGYLCPPIPGRADYIHRLSDLLVKDTPVLKNAGIKALDIGVGANCIYPIIGVTEYGWHYTASDIDPVSVKSAQVIAENNAVLQGNIHCRLQSEARHFFHGIILPDEYYHVTTCNPPFHKSLQEATKGTERKINNLNANRQKRGQNKDSGKGKGKTVLNFAGQKAELWCSGGEEAFIKNMARESGQYKGQVLWFSTLVSKKENVRFLRKALEKAAVTEIKIVEMQQGQKKSRFVCWSFMNQSERNQWLTERG